MIEQGKQQIEQLQQQLNEAMDEKDDKDDELRLKKYEIDVKAEIEMAKLAKNAGLQPNDVIAIVNQILANAAQQPELRDDDDMEYQQDAQMIEPQFEQDDSQLTQEGQMMDEQMPMDMGGGVDVSQLQLPDVEQEQSFD
jgi:hypothetical protein